MRNILARFDSQLLDRISETKKTLESLEIFERAIYWNTQSDEQDQAEALKAFDDISRDIEKLTQSIAKMRASYTYTKAEICKLYLAFVEEQFSILTKEIEIREIGGRDE